MENSNIEESQAILKSSFEKLGDIDFSEFSKEDRKEIKQELEEVEKLILAAKSSMKQLS